MVGLVKLVRQAKMIRDAVESDGEGRGFKSGANLPYLVYSSHSLLVSPPVRAVKKNSTLYP